nr:uncharacterized protein LOC109180199 [Ipomoea batatas]
MDVGNGRRFPRANRDATILNRIMLKFRPIAPKPVAAGSASASAQEDNKTDDVTKRRSKRKYVRVKKKVSRCYSSRNNNNNPGGEEEEEERRNPSRLDTSLLTLQLLPESSGSSTSTAVDSPKKGSFEKMLNFSSSAQERPLWMNNNNFDNHRNNDIAAVLWADQRMGLRVVESWVMVEGLSKIWVDEDGGGIGDTDMEKMKNLEVDTCPGLISEGLDRVQWVNLAYRRMVDPLHGGGGPPAEVVARLVVKDKIRTALPAAFACTVRVMYTRHTGKHTQTMPCDVWKMEFGGFAWRFDAQAALCLGR